MTQIKCLYVAIMDTLSGGNKRRYEILKRSGKFGVVYIPVLDSTNYPQALKFYPDLARIMSNLSGYTVKIRGHWGRLGVYLNFVKCAEKISLIAKENRVNLIVAIHESFDVIQIVSLASRFSGIPWTVIIQADPIIPDITSPFSGSRIDIVKQRHKVSLPKALLKLARIQLTLLRLRETLSLSVSNSVSNELKYFEPRLAIKVLNPQLGVSDPIFNVNPKDCGCNAMFFARLVPSKGIFELPEIWSLVIQRIPKAKLGIAGPWEKQEDRIAFENLCERYHTKDNISYLGLLPELVLFEYLKSVKVLVYPSLWDAFPFVVLEALACGVPVVAYNTNPIRFSYRGIESVKTVSPKNNKEMADAVVDLLTDEKKRERLSRDASRFASKFTWDNVGKEEAESFSEILKFWESKKEVASDS